MSALAPRLRSAAAEDARPIAEVHVAAWQGAYRGLLPDSYLNELTVEQRTALWQRAIAEPRSSSLVVAEVEGSLAGFCLFAPTRDEDGGTSVGEIIALNVQPDRWRRGIGRALCEFALREAPSRGWATITLWTLKGNERANRFYVALGFSRDGADRINTRLIGSPLHELRYRKAL